MLRYSLLFFDRERDAKGLSALVAVAAPTANVMQRAKMELRAGGKEVYVGYRTVGRAAPGCNHCQRGW
jgi:hypothetical protein